MDRFSLHSEKETSKTRNSLRMAALLDKWILPNLGNKLLSEVRNSALRQFVEILSVDVSEPLAQVLCRYIKAVDRACTAVTGARNLSQVFNIRKI